MHFNTIGLYEHKNFYKSAWKDIKKMKKLLLLLALMVFTHNCTAGVVTFYPPSWNGIKYASKIQVIDGVLITKLVLGSLASSLVLKAIPGFSSFAQKHALLSTVATSSVCALAIAPWEIRKLRLGTLMMTYNGRSVQGPDQIKKELSYFASLIPGAFVLSTLLLGGYKLIRAHA